MNSAATADDTIVAVATPPGRGGIGVVRLSGGLAEDIARHMLGGLPQPRVAMHTEFLDPSGAQIDAGIALYFPGPASFTGETVIEMHGHGGPTVMAMLVDAAVELGARRAEAESFHGGHFSMTSWTSRKRRQSLTSSPAEPSRRRARRYGP